MQSGGIKTTDLKQTNIGIMIVAIKVYTQKIVQSPEYGSACTGMPHQSVNAVQMITTVKDTQKHIRNQIYNYKDEDLRVIKSTWMQHMIGKHKTMAS
jgi:hypothetical protein